MNIGAVGQFQLENARGGVETLQKFTNGSSKVTERSVTFEDYLTGAAEKAPAAKTKIDKADKLYEQCEALETFLLKILLNGMRKTVPKSELIEKGFAGEMYEDMLWDEYATSFTKNSDFGLAEMAYLELTGQRGKVMEDGAGMAGF
jgi:flagellar protein FlgJ